MRQPITRRAAIQLGLGAAAMLVAGCAGAPHPSPDGSTITSTWSDPTGDGTLSVASGAALIDRTDLAPRAQLGREIARLVHLTDAHILDAQSPARVTFLDRLGPPFTSTFRPQEALTAQVLSGAIAAINSYGPHAVIQGGDLIDNAQRNELEQALRILAGGRVAQVSGTGAYVGVQSAADPDPFYYRPDIDAPLHPGLLARALAPFSSPGLRAPVYPVLGDHDILVAGVLPPTLTTQAIATGDRAVWDLPRHLSVPRVSFDAAAPDGLTAPGEINALIRRLLSVPSMTVPADQRRRQVSVPQALTALRGAPADSTLLDYHFDVGPELRVIVLDLVRRDGGSGGVVHPGQPAWLAAELRAAGERWVIVVSHQPLDTTAKGVQLLALLDRHPRTLAAMWGHTHHSRIVPRPAANGGYWLIATASLIDFPQQARALRILATPEGGVALETWMIDHVPDRPLGDIARALAYLDAQGGRPQDSAGTPLDRNTRLYRARPSQAPG
jgi:3',5'-cyclic AMP phosphodiesterase CpdA